MADNQYVVEYAKTGRSSCKLRGKTHQCPVVKIEKAVLRLGIQKPNFMDDSGDSMMTDWFHAPCFFSKLSRMRKSSRTVSSPDDLDGFDALAPEDQVLVKDYIDGKRSFQADIQLLATTSSSTSTTSTTSSTTSTTSSTSSTSSSTAATAASGIPSILGSKRKAEAAANPNSTQKQKPLSSSSGQQPPPLSAGDLAAAALAAGKRICRYGASCYRENPNHLRDFWHPPGSKADSITPAIHKVNPAALPPPPPSSSTTSGVPVVGSGRAQPMVIAPNPPPPSSFSSSSSSGPLTQAGGVPGSGVDFANAVAIENEIQALIASGGGGGGSGGVLADVEIHANYNQDITDILEELGKLEKNKGNGTKHKSYMAGATALQMLPRRVKSGKDARVLDGIGVKMAAKVDEILATGTLESLERARADEKLQALSLVCSVDGIGPVLARKLVFEHGVRTLEDLKAHVGSFNTYQKTGLELHEEFRTRIPREEVSELERIALSALPEVDPRLLATVCGSYRRGRSSCGDIDILLTHPDYDAGACAKKAPTFLADFVSTLTAKGFFTHELGLGTHKYTGVCALPTPGSLHRRIDVLWIPYEEYPFALLYFTGSGFFNIQMRKVALDLGYSLNEHGLFPIDPETKAITGPSVRVNTERDVFRVLRMKYRTPPERDLAATWKPTMS